MFLHLHLLVGNAGLTLMQPFNKCQQQEKALVTLQSDVNNFLVVNLSQNKESIKTNIKINCGC